MSGIQVVNQAETAWLKLITDVDMTLRLYTNDVLAGLTDVEIEALTEAAFTEATFAGYSAVALTNPWTIVPGNPSKATVPQQTFTRTSTGTAELIYGYYLTRIGDGALMWFEQFDGPVSMEFQNDVLNVTPELTLDDAGGFDVEVGTIVAYGGTTAPDGWLLCDGSAVSRSEYPQLFAVIGTAFGAGDGSTTFNVPNLQQRFPLGKGSSGTGSQLGETGGSIDHQHGLDNPNSAARLSWPASSGQVRIYRRTSGVPAWTSNVATTQNQSALTGDSTSGITGGLALIGDTESANPPYVTVNFIIKAA